MKAIRLQERGGPEKLVYEDAPEPGLNPGDALVQVYATGITPTELIWDDTYTNCDGSERLPTIPGHEVSGIVERIAADVSDVQIGDEVYGLTSFCRDGSAAEYVAVRAADLAPKPTSLDHTQTAAVPLSALTIWQAYFDHAHLKSGQRVLIHGAAGGVGTFGVQIAHWCGAHVIGTVRKNRDFLRGLGADEVIDYQQGRFEEATRDVDLVLTRRRRNARTVLASLKACGMLITLPGRSTRVKGLRRRGLFFVVQPSRVQPARSPSCWIPVSFVIVAQSVPLANAHEAFERGVAGHTRGKLVLQVNLKTYPD